MFFSTKFVIFPEVTEVTKFTEFGSAKGDCRSREFARFSFVLSVAEQKSFDFFGVNHYSSRYVQDCSNCPQGDWFTDMQVKVSFTDLNGNLIGNIYFNLVLNKN